MTERRKGFLYCFALASVVTAILWITLFSREQAHRVAYLIPFWSYVRAFQGDIGLLREDISNILMFLPLGFLFTTLFGMSWKKAAIFGFAFSAVIEVLQYTLELGSFEVDDLINNTIGVALGILFRVKPVQIEKRKLYKTCAYTTAVIMLFSFAGQAVYSEVHHQKMLRFAALSGENNLLLLHGKNGYAWDTDVYVEFQNDGSMRIKGTSDIRSWYPIGNQALDAGSYTFSGLDGVEPRTIAIEIAFYDDEQGKYIQTVRDLGPYGDIVFSLPDRTNIRTYVSVYPGCDCDAIARPAIYKEGVL